MQHARFRRATLLVAAACLCAACGGADEAAGPCGLFSADEAAAILQAPVTDTSEELPAVRIADVTTSRCAYASDNGSSISYAINRYPSPEIAATRYETLQSTYAAFFGTLRRIQGVGDAAFAVQEQLVARRGNTQIGVEVEFQDDRRITSYDDLAQVDALVAVQTKLAQDVLSRLPVRAP
jgi:hypothetical protein